MYSQLLIWIDFFFWFLMKTQHFQQAFERIQIYCIFHCDRVNFSLVLMLFFTWKYSTFECLPIWLQLNANKYRTIVWWLQEDYFEKYSLTKSHQKYKHTLYSWYNLRFRKDFQTNIPLPNNCFKNNVSQLQRNCKHNWARVRVTLRKTDQNSA